MAMEDEIDPVTGLKKVKSTTTATDQATPPAATPGGTYLNSQLQKRLAGQDPVVENQKQTNQAQDAIQNYLAGRAARQTSAQAGWTPGTLQYQRTQDREMATAAQANLERGKALADLTASRSTEALGLARDQETKEQSYITDLISSLSENPVAQNYLRRVQAAGGDVRQAYESMFPGGTGSSSTPGGSGSTGGTDAGGATSGAQATGTTTTSPGTFSAAFRPQNAAEVALQGEMDKLRVIHPDWSDEQLRTEAVSRRTSADQASQTATDTALRQTNLENAQRKVKTSGFESLTPDEKTAFLGGVQMREASALPTGKAEIKKILQGEGDPFFKLGDKPYQIVDYYQQTRWNRQGVYSNRHTDWAMAKDLTTGKTSYISSDGDVLDYQPPNAGDGWKLTLKDGIFERGSGSTHAYYNPATKSWQKQRPDLSQGTGGTP